ncbi:helix-turn-helix transcriptional regulator [Paenibacillus lactis]|uniref:DNA-binding transcriptional regulator YafY n=1 Tax=Paenibacillus lactis TaxID=228574 RepID=A0ABS4F5P2_9BACL|nr:YafY family protein [Paenibacillus lactis]MBP1891392.1 putative DNA-binding transcriptional regulator YafY [Paenibacillus lactis]HAF98237.1 YafY family transcriptional regulator [Paenibacillus lactis]
MQKSQRLIQLIMMINAKKSFTVRELADEFGLSTRTITRDLQELSELGIPIYSIQGRGGGYKLLQDRMLPPISLSESEAIAMFFACQSLDYFSSLPFGEGAESALQKFYHYLPADIKEQIDRLDGRIMLWSPYRSMAPGILQTLMQAIMTGEVVTMEYNSSSGIAKRDIQPIGLYTSSGYWYCPAYCFEREDIRQFRADRILSAALNPSVPPLDEIRKMTLMNKPEKGHLDQTVLHIEITRKGVWLLESNPRFAPSIQRNEDGSGAAAIQIATEDLRFYVDLIWNLGSEVKIKGPVEAITYIQEKVEAMRSLYS